MSCNYSLHNGDCIEIMNSIADKSIDMILCDLPYGTTQNKWDSVIPFDSLWRQYKRVIKDNGAIVLFGSEPFSTELRHSNLPMYKYDWIWEKPMASGFLNARRMPLKSHEEIMVFYKKLPTYNPQMETGEPYTKKQKSDGRWGGMERSKEMGISTSTTERDFLVA